MNTESGQKGRNKKEESSSLTLAIAVSLVLASVVAVFALGFVGTATANDAPTHEATGMELAVVDTTVDDHEALVRAAREGGLAVENVSGAEEMTAALEGRSNLAAVHVLSHGTVGTIRVGNDTLTRERLGQYSGLTAALDASLAPDGDLLLYGCRVATDGGGQAFLGAVGNATGADVAASTDLTGNAAQGGDWDLEATSGAVSAAAVGANGTVSGFGSLLAIPSDENYDDNIDKVLDTDPGEVVDGIRYESLFVDAKITNGTAYETELSDFSTDKILTFPRPDAIDQGESLVIRDAQDDRFRLREISVHVPSESDNEVELVPDGDTSAAVDFNIGNTSEPVDLTGKPAFENVKRLEFRSPGITFIVDIDDINFGLPNPRFDAGSSTTLTVSEDATNISIDSLLTASANGGNGDTFTWSVSAAPSHGNLEGFTTSEPSGSSVTPSGLTYTPNNDYAGSDSFDVQVEDGNGNTDTITVDVDVQDAPEVSSITRNDSDPTNADSVTFDVTFSESVSGVNTSDFSATTVSGDASGSVASVGNPSGTTISVTVDSITGDGDLRLDLSDNDSITNGNDVPLGGVGTNGSADGSYTSGERYTIDNTDPGFSSTATATIDEGTTGTVVDVEAGDDGTTSPDTNVTYSLGGTDAGPFSIDSNNGSLSLDSAQDFENPSDSDGNGDYELTVTATDDVGNSKVQGITVTLNDVNEAPTVINNTGSSIDEGATDIINQSELETTDPDQGPSSLTYTVETDVSEGQLVNTDTLTQVDQNDTFTQADINDGFIEYQHDGTEPTSESFDFTVRDTAGLSATGTFSFTINQVNDVPEVSIASLPNTFDEGENVTLNASFTDPDSGDTHTATVDWGDGTTQSASVDQTNDTVSASYAYTGGGIYTVTVTVTDDDGGTGSAEETVNVQADCLDRRSVSRGQEGRACPSDDGISRGESRGETDPGGGRDGETRRRDRSRGEGRSRGR